MFPRLTPVLSAVPMLCLCGSWPPPGSSLETAPYMTEADLPPREENAPPQAVGVGGGGYLYMIN